MRSLFRSTAGSTGKRFFAAVGCALTLAAGTTVAVPEAEAQVAMSSPEEALDGFLTITGAPGPHRVPGHYFTSPTPPPEQEQIRPTVLVGPSTPILLADNSVCTVGVAGFDKFGNKVAITAGHCGNPGDAVVSGDAFDSGRIGTFVRSGNLDYGVIKLNPNVQITRNYGAARINSLGGALPAQLSQICKTGISTGTSCGTYIAPFEQDIVAHICASHGDSGGPVYQNGRLVALVSGGLAGIPSCTTPLQGPFHAPVVGTQWNEIAKSLDANGGVGAGFRLA